MQTNLYFNNGSSDKVYQASIIAEGEGYLVNFAYGRRGNALKSGSKTANPVNKEKAQAIFDKLVKSKVSKGYTPDENGSIYSAVDSEQSNIQCQLLNPIDEKDAILLCSNDGFLLQEKFDGIRQLLEKTTQGVKAINRKGLYVGLSETTNKALRATPYTSITLDGEGMGDYNRVFDILELDGKSLRDLPYEERFNILNGLTLDTSVLRVVKAAYTTDEKLKLINDVKKRNGEGVVFKQRQSTYLAGRPSSGGDQLKFKFYAGASVMVSALNDSKRSVQISVLDDSGADKLIGNVTIPPNYDMPKIGQIVEVRYLYAYPGDGSLYQPNYLGLRTDKDAPDMHRSLKFKGNS